MAEDGGSEERERVAGERRESRRREEREALGYTTV